MQPDGKRTDTTGYSEHSMANFDNVPVIDISSLYESRGSAQKMVDNAIGAASQNVGFFVISGDALAELASAKRIEQILRFFDLSADQKRPMARKKYVPAN